MNIISLALRERGAVLRNKSLLLKVISMIVFIVLGIEVLYFIIQFNNLKTNFRTNFIGDLSIVGLGIIFLISLSIDLRSFIAKSKNLSVIKYKTNRLSHMVTFFASIFCWGVLLFAFVEFFFHPSISFLAEIIFVLCGVYSLTSEMIIGTGISQDGIFYRRNFFTWEEIKSFSWKNNENELTVKYIRKETLIFKEGKFKIRVEVDDKLLIDSLIKSKIINCK